MNAKPLAALTLCLASLALIGCPGKGPGEPPGEVPGGTDGGGGEGSPAHLEVSIAASPRIVSVGQSLTLDITVRNTGGSTATSVAPTTPLPSGAGLAILRDPPELLSTELPSGGTQVFTYVYEATDPGALTFEVGADGMDSSTEYPLTAARVTASVVVEGAAMLMVDEVQVPSNATVGTDFTVTVRVVNGGQTAASAVVPSLTLTGVATATVVSGPTPANAAIPGGGSATFSYTYRPVTAGIAVFEATAAGSDSNSGQPLAAEATSSRAFTIDTPAALTATFSIPTDLSTGQAFTATLVVKNTGTATAKSVVPAPLIPAAVGTAGASATVGPASKDVAGGATETFTWAFVASGTGTFRLEARAAGTDENTGAAVQSPLATSNTATVAVPSALAVTSLAAPNQINRGQTFNVTMTVKNNGAVALTGVIANPNPPTASATGAALATTASAPAPVLLAAGASATFTWSFMESGTGVGNLTFAAAARGTTGGGAVLNANPTQSNLVVVRSPPSLVVESVVLPAKISTAQGFNAVVTVKNLGGSVASGVLPSLTWVKGDAASATSASTFAPVDLVGGAKATFTYVSLENGTGAGTLRADATASGSDLSSGQPVSAASKSSATMMVQTRAELSIANFSLPGTLNRGQPFALSMTVVNLGEANAVAVLPVPVQPTVALTGGAGVVTTTTPSAVTIVGGGSQTFTWLYTENGTAAGSVRFTGAVTGADGNSGAPVSAPVKPSNLAAVATPVGCNGSALYTGFGGISLDGLRLDRPVGSDRLRIKPYSMLPAELNRMVGVTPPSITGQGPTFNQPEPRWSIEPAMSGVSMYQTYKAAFEGCLQLTSTGAAYSANPTAATAATECAKFQKNFWNRIPSGAETTACVNYTTGAVNNDANPRRRWAYSCASVLSSLGFIAH